MTSFASYHILPMGTLEVLLTELVISFVIVGRTWSKPMPSLNWKHYAVIFASVSGMPVFCYWYYSLPHVVDRFTEKWMIEEPEKDNKEFREFMKELSEMRQKVDYAEIKDKIAAEEMRRRTLRQ